jgi:hypothetical protein
MHSLKVSHNDAFYWMYARPQGAEYAHSLTLHAFRYLRRYASRLVCLVPAQDDGHSPIACYSHGYITGARSWRDLDVSDSFQLANHFNTNKYVSDHETIPDGQINHHLLNLLSDTYFRRIWTVQELAMSQSAVIVCGDSTIS